MDRQQQVNCGPRPAHILARSRAIGEFRLKGIASSSVTNTRPPAKRQLSCAPAEVSCVRSLSRTHLAHVGSRIRKVQQVSCPQISNAADRCSRSRHRPGCDVSTGEESASFGLVTVLGRCEQDQFDALGTADVSVMSWRYLKKVANFDAGFRTRCDHPHHEFA